MAEVTIATNYIPNPQQLVAHSAPERWTLYGGGEGGGKTRWLVEEVIQLMLEYPGIEGVMCRHDQNDVIKPTQVYDAFHALCPSELIKDDVRSYPMWTRFHNKSRVTWMGLKDYSPSSEYGFAGIDQAEECDEDTVRLLNGRLRQRLPDGTFPHFRMLLTCNPHPNMEWFLTECLTYPEEFVFVKALWSDNPYLPDDFFQVRQKSYSKEYFERLVHGSWDAFAGQALSEFNRDIHIVKEPFDHWRKDGWPVYIGIDFGTSAPTVAEWVTVSPDGHLFFIQEYTRANVSPETNARAIKQLSGGMRVRGVWIDPRTTSEHVSLDRLNWSVFDEYKSRLKPFVVQLGRGKRESRLAAWKQALHLSPDLLDYRTMLSPAPRVYIFPNCQGLITTIPKLEFKVSESGHSDDIAKSNDHWYDAGGFVLTHLLKNQTPFYQIRDMNVKLHL